MNAIYLHLPDGTATKWSMCSVCKTVACPGNFDLSQKCCTCYECGEPLPEKERVRYTQGKSYALRHDACEKKRRAMADIAALEKAQLVEDYDGPVFFEGLRGSYGDGYFSDVGELSEALDDYEPDDDEPGFSRPQFAFCCKEVKFNLDISRVIEAVLEEMDDDAGERLSGTDDLTAAVEAFNKANEGVVSFYEDRKRKVAIPPAPPDSASGQGGEPA